MNPECDATLFVFCNRADGTYTQACHRLTARLLMLNMSHVFHLVQQHEANHVYSRSCRAHMKTYALPNASDTQSHHQALPAGDTQYFILCHSGGVYLELVLALFCSLLGSLQGSEGLPLVTCQLPQLRPRLLPQPIHTSFQLLLRICSPAQQPVSAIQTLSVLCMTRICIQAACPLAALHTNQYPCSACSCI